MDVPGNVYVDPPRIVETFLEGARSAAFSRGIVL
jgi:hypothetical protein